MSILARYMVREFLKFFGILQFTFLGLYLMVQIIQRVDDFLEAGAPSGLFVEYIASQIPFVVVQLCPVAVLVSVIVVLCLMVKHHEVTALKSCGVHILRLARPLGALALLIAAAAFLVSELVAPYTMARANHIWKVELKKGRKNPLYWQTNIWYKGRQCIYRIGRVDPQTERMYRVTLYFLDPSFRLTRRIDAMGAQWTPQAWIFEHGLVQELLPEQGGYRVCPFERLTQRLPEAPTDFVRPARTPEEMGYWQLERYVDRLTREGYDATAYRVELQIKLAFPLLNLLMVLLGFPIALWIARGKTPVAVSLGIFACFLYLLIFGVSRSLGLSGALPPMAAAWLANAIFFLIAAYLLAHVET